METFLQDIRYGIRMVAKSPGFAAIAILTLALGIGANTALFSVVNGVLLNPLPYRQPDRLMAIYAKTREFEHSSISYPNFLDWVRSQRSFSSIAAFREENYNLTGVGEPERVKAEMVSADFFSVLGVNPVAGRLLRPEEDQVGAQPVALISGGFWKRRFGSSPDAVGKTLTLNGVGYTVVGMIPADFRYQSGNFQNSDVYVPIGQWNDTTFRDRRTSMGMDAVGRLKPGVTLQQAQSDMDAVAQRLAEAYPDADKGSGIALLALKQDVVGNIRPFLLVLLGAVGFVLLIACVNVANLLLARSTGRIREFAIRAALGARRGRVMRQLLTESLVLSCAGGGLGLLLAAWGTQAAIRLMPEALPRRGFRAYRFPRFALYSGRVCIGGNLLRTRAGAENLPRRPARNAERRRARVKRRAPPVARALRGRRNGDGAGVAGRRGVDDPQPGQPLERQSGLQSAPRGHFRGFLSHRSGRHARCHSLVHAPAPGYGGCRSRGGGGFAQRGRAAHVRRFRGAVLD